MSCLSVSEDDFVGIDGIIDPWTKKITYDTTTLDTPVGLIHLIRTGWSEKHDKPILSYSVDMMAILRKNFLMPKGPLPPCTAVPRAYGLPHYRVLYATV
ncbi:hypothetical protein PMAYCL1PPCAC_14410, partial [Pristionchus mayeri]